MFSVPNTTTSPTSISQTSPGDTSSPTAAKPPQNPIHSPEQRKASHPAPHGLSARSCVTCRRRKVKCDKQEPCSNCVKAGSQCIFPAPGRAPRRPRVGGTGSSEREAELLKRLRRLEGVVEELSGQVEIEAVKNSPASDTSSLPKDGESSEASSKIHNVRVVGMDEGSGATKKEWITRAWHMGTGPPKTDFGLNRVEAGIGRLVIDEGKSRYMSHPFWSQITDEVTEIKQLLTEQEFDSDSDNPIVPTDEITDSNHQSFIMGYSSSNVDLKPLHPLPSQIPFYWQTFLDNVQPLVMIIHAPTMSKTIKQAQNNLESLSKSTEALMFSIYHATITSMSSNEVQTNFGISKELLLKQYRFGTEQALARAGLLNTNEIVTMQAFVLFLVCVRRHDDTRFVWTMTGLAIRIAQSLGLHRDGTKFGLSPFDTEMRRRLWWQLCILDVRASEDHGSDPSILDYTFDTEFPISCNDEDLNPNSVQPPARRPGVSEMTFCLIRYEICSLTRRLSYTPPGKFLCKLAARSFELTLEEKEKLVRESADHLEKTYLQYCENAGPLYWVAATVARLITAKMSLILYHPLTQPGQPSTLNQDTRDRLLMASIEIIEYSKVLEEESSTKRWGWLFKTYIQWHAIAYILGELCVRESSTTVDRAWKAIDSVFGEWGKTVAHSKSNKNGMLWNPMKKLMLKARRKREENVAKASPEENLGPGMPSNILRPPPVLYPRTMPTNIPNISQTRNSLLPQISDSREIINSNAPLDTAVHLDIPMMSPQILGMGLPTPAQAQAHIQPQMQQQIGQQQNTWVMNDHTLLGDLDMNLDGDVNWEGWDDLVRDFQMETQAGNVPGSGNGNVQTELQRGPTLGGMGSWW
ncbi:fungal-specific transcription factor domain-containing protein [Tricladium varicosporioides]|nr:fungal-specific transcription factor domain-containing protein [Hymenoscyphus varicosporioides]